MESNGTFRSTGFLTFQEKRRFGSLVPPSENMQLEIAAASCMTNRNEKRLRPLANYFALVINYHP